jgi:hypothetical protein
MGELSKTVVLNDRSKLNGQLRGARNNTMLGLIGNPRSSYDQDCRQVTNDKIKSLVVTKDVGPFSVTGLRPAVETLHAILADVEREEPAVHAVLSTAGMLCCRNVRGSATAISNHSWGTAIDLKIEGALDVRGDGRAQVGLLKIHPIFNRHGFYWGAAFPTEDAMHFEASDELIRKWNDDGMFGNAIVEESDELVSFGERSTLVVELQQRLNIVLGTELDADGIFGPATRAAVIQFQRAQSLTMNGLVNPRTWQTLMTAAQQAAA